MSKASETALLSHIISQTQANISFLVAHNYISGPDASDMINRLAEAQAKGIASSSTTALANGTSSLSIIPTPQPSITPPPARRAIPPPPPRYQRAKALWAYNANESEPNDLSFSAGEVVEIVEETNDDWWTGKCRGRQGLFPSNHVEKIEGGSGGPPPPSAPSPWSGAVAMPSAQVPDYPSAQVPDYPSPGYQSHGGDKAPYRPFGAAYGNDMPPPNGLQPRDEPKEHKDGKKGKKFGKLGGTMANAAAGGVGFGAGAAIGSGIVNAIF